MSEQREKFLARWSRLKLEADPAQTPVESSSPPVADPDAPPPPLPALETLTIESDYTGFLHPKVDETLRRAALRKLFADPHFNVMDGLDVYIDDYSKSDPLPAHMLSNLKQAQKIIAWAREDAEKAAADAAPAAGAAESPPSLECARDEAPIAPAVAAGAPVGPIAPDEAVEPKP